MVAFKNAVFVNMHNRFCNLAPVFYILLFKPGTFVTEENKLVFFVCELNCLVIFFRLQILLF